MHDCDPHRNFSGMFIFFWDMNATERKRKRTGKRRRIILQVQQFEGSGEGRKFFALSNRHELNRVWEGAENNIKGVKVQSD